MKFDNVKRGEIYLTDLSHSVGSEQNGIRPALIISNDVGNKYSSTFLIAPFTSCNKKSYLPTHVFISHQKAGLQKSSVAMLEQIRTIDQSRLNEYIGKLDWADMQRIDNAIAVSLGINNQE